MKSFLISIGLALAIFLILWLFPTSSENLPHGEVQGLPWQIQVSSDGNAQVFGITLGVSTLADAQSRFGGESELAAVATPGESASVEVFFRNFTAGVISGKIVLTADLPPDTIAAMWQRARKVEYMESSTKKALLSEADTTAAQQALIRSIAFVPSINLDEAMIIQRFGKPAERLRSDTDTEHFLYPERGLDVVLSSKNKEVLQYVAPRDFDVLRQPLIEAQRKLETEKQP